MKRVGVPAGHRLQRRTLLRGAAGVAAVGGLALAGCGPQKSQPTTQAPVVTITFQPYFVALGGNAQTAQKLAAQALAEYSSQGGSKGVRIKLDIWQSTQANISAMAAGTGADVIYDYHYAPYIEPGLIAPLEGYVKDFGVDESVWSAGQLAVYKENGHLYALPAYMGTVCYAYNQSAFDALGVAYPSSDWTSGDFVSLCKQLSGTNSDGSARYGGMLYQWNNQINGSRWIFNAFGGSLMNADGTAGTLSSSGSVAAGKYMFEQLYWPKICTVRAGNYQQLFQQGNVVMRTLGTWEIFPAVLAYQNNIKWDILPFPTYPAGRTTFSTDDFWAVNAQSKNLKEAAEVAVWASSSPYWNKFNMQLQLLSPARVDLWDQWASTVQQVAAPLKGKALNWYGDAAQKGYALAPLYYKYDDTQCEAAVGTVISQLWSQQLSDVATAFAQADQLVDAIIAQAEASSTSSAGSSSASASSGSKSGSASSSA